MRTFAAGFLATVLLQVLVSNARATSVAGGLFSLPAAFANRLLSPDVPAIPHLRTGAAPSVATTPTPGPPASAYDTATSPLLRGRPN